MPSQSRGRLPEIITIGIKVRSTWRCLRSSVTFRSSMTSSILAGGRLGWSPFLPRAGWKKYYSGERKGLKTWKKKLGRSWMRKPWQLSVLLDGRSIEWVFYGENNVLAVGAILGPLSKEVGKSIDSEAASLSSPHAWRYTYQVSHCRIFFCYQWSR